MMRVRKITVDSDGYKIHGILHYSDKTAPLVITSHGLFSSKDSSKYIEIADKFCAEGFNVLRFDYRGCGESEGSILDSTVQFRVHDLLNIIDSVSDEFRNIFLLGSSLGGVISIIVARKVDAISGIICWSTPYNLRRLAIKFRNEIPDRIYREFLSIDLGKYVNGLCNILIIHGQCDELVPIDDAFLIYEDAEAPKCLYIIGDADHRFTNPHHRKIAINESIIWLKRILKFSVSL